MLWPMMPQETLAQLAQSFYPNSPILAQRFIQKSIRLSRSLGIIIAPDVSFEHAQVIAIPDEKEVRALTHRIKKREELLTDQEQLRLSYQLKMAFPPTPHNASTPKAVASATTHQPSVAFDLFGLHVPTISLPPLPRPNVGHMLDRVKSASHHVWGGVQDAWQTGMARLADWQVYALGNLDQKPQTYLAQILSYQHSRIALFLGGLGLLAWVIWHVQKRYLQKKIALLNTIESTLNEPELTAPTISEIYPIEDDVVINAHTSMLDSEPVTSSSATDFQDVESLIEPLPVEAQHKEDGISGDVTTRSER